MTLLRLTLPPLTPREALTLSYLCSLLDDLLWASYGDAMSGLLDAEPFVPEPWWSIDRDLEPSRTARPRGASRGMPRCGVLSDGKEVERADVKKRGR